MIPQLLAILALACACLRQGGNRQTDAKARIQSALEASKLGYAASPTGLSFTVVFEHDQGRRQTVFVATEPGNAGGLVMHSIYTNVWSAPTPPDEALVRRMMATNKKLGAFYLYRSKDSWAIRFGASFDATDLPTTSKAGEPLVERLAATIRFVDVVGEEVDAELNGAKDHR